MVFKPTSSEARARPTSKPPMIILAVFIIPVGLGFRVYGLGLRGLPSFVANIDIP